MKFEIHFEFRASLRKFQDLNFWDATVNQHGHGNHGGGELRSANAERRGRLGGERAEQLGKCESKTTARGKPLLQEMPPRAPWKNPPGAHLAPKQLNR
jgi:hypothetical protein